MLRKIIIALGLFVALVPYLGFPSSWDTVMLTAAGLFIVFLLLLSKRPHLPSISTPNFWSENNSTKDIMSPREYSEDTDDDQPKNLHVEHTEVEERPLVHIERETVVDTESVEELPGTETVVEKKVTITRKRRKKEAGSQNNTEEQIAEYGET